MLQNLFLCAFEGRGVFEGPGNAFDVAGEDGAAFGGLLVTNGNDGVVGFVLLEEVEDALGRLAVKIDADLLHDSDDVGVHGPGFYAGAFGLKAVATVFLQEGLGHLAAGGVVDANEEDLVFDAHVEYINIAILRLVGANFFSNSYLRGLRL